MNANEQVYEVPLVELLERVPKDARFWVEEKHSSTHYPVGRLSHEAAEMLRQQQAEIEELEAELFVKDAFLKTSICLSKAELESGLTRVQWAEALIKQLPEEHEGRNSWLLNYGKAQESLGAKFEKVLNDNLWEMLEEDGKAQEK